MHLPSLFSSYPQLYLLCRGKNINSSSFLDKRYKTEAGCSCVVIIWAIPAQIDLLVEYEQRFVPVSNSWKISNHLLLNREMVVWIVTCCVIPCNIAEVAVSDTIHTHMHDWFSTHWAGSFAASILAHEVLMSLVLVFLAMLQISVSIRDLLLLLPSHAAWTFRPIIRKFALAQSLVWARHLGLIIGSVVLLRSRLVIDALHINVCSSKAYQCDFSLAIRSTQNLSTLTSLQLWILHLLSSLLVPSGTTILNVSVLHLETVPLVTGAALLLINFNDGDSLILLLNWPKDCSVLLLKSIEFDFIPTRILTLVIYLAQLLLRQLDYLLSEERTRWNSLVVLLHLSKLLICWRHASWPTTVTLFLHIRLVSVHHVYSVSFTRVVGGVWSINSCLTWSSEELPLWDINLARTHNLASWHELRSLLSLMSIWFLAFSILESATWLADHRLMHNLLVLTFWLTIDFLLIFVTSWALNWFTLSWCRRSTEIARQVLWVDCLSSVSRASKDKSTAVSLSGEPLDFPLNSLMDEMLIVSLSFLWRVWLRRSDGTRGTLVIILLWISLLRSILPVQLIGLFIAKLELGAL